MKLIYKIWLRDDSGRAFGEGPYRLLKGVELTGSLLQAAADMGMAYTKARRIILCCERTLGFALTHRKVGGASGGGSEVTPQAFELMSAYESLRAEVEDAIGEAYMRHFGQLIPVRVRLHKTVTRKRGAKDRAGTHG